MLLALLLGLAYAVPPGPITAETVRQGSRGGFWAALAVQTGAIAADGIYALLASLGLATMFARPLPHALIGIAGTILLLILGTSSMRHALHGGEVSPAKAVQESDRATSTAPRTFVAGLGLSFVNPYSVLFWLSIDSVLLPANQPIAGLTLATFFLAVAGWGIVLAFGVSSCRFLRSARVLRLTSILCGLIFLVSGLSFGQALVIAVPF